MKKIRIQGIHPKKLIRKKQAKMLKGSARIAIRKPKFLRFRTRYWKACRWRKMFIRRAKSRPHTTGGSNRESAKESTSKSEEEQKPQKEKNPESAAEAKKAEKAQRNTDRGRQRAERTKQKEEHAKRKEAQKEQKIQQKEEKRRRREKQREKLEDFLDQIQNPENQRSLPPGSHADRKASTSYSADQAFDTGKGRTL